MTSPETVDAPEYVDFGGLTIAFDNRVLRPRAWTEHHSRWAAELLPTLPDGPVLELCAGVGHIGLHAVAGSQRRLVSVEADPVAAAYLRTNAEAAGVDVDLREGLLPEVLDEAERFPLVIADPPYLRTEETRQYPEDPLLAVDGGDDGLVVVRECLEVIARHLAPGGTALVQLRDRAQVEQVVELLPADLAQVDVEEHPGHGAVLRLERSS